MRSFLNHLSQSCHTHKHLPFLIASPNLHHVIIVTDVDNVALHGIRTTAGRAHGEWVHIAECDLENYTDYVHIDATTHVPLAPIVIKGNTYPTFLAFAARSCALTAACGLDKMPCVPSEAVWCGPLPIVATISRVRRSHREVERAACVLWAIATQCAHH